MKKSNTLILSSIVLAFLTTGCVKKPVPVAVAPASPQPIYDGSVVYEEAAPIIYDNGVGTNQSGAIYGSEVPDNTVITTNESYGQPVGGNGAYNQPQGGSYGQPTGGNGIYGQPVDGGGYNEPYTAPASGGNYGTYNDTPAPQGGGINLQVAALRDYAAAESFKNSLSLDPRYSAYVQRGAVNKVIVSGIGSVAEANQLKATRFPGAFIVSGNSNAGGGYAPPASSSGAYSDYSVNEPYGSTPTSSSSSYGGGLGVQIGAFSSRSKAQSVANSQGGRYNATVKEGSSRGRRIYKVILTGFSSENAARSYASSHNGFLVH